MPDTPAKCMVHDKKAPDTMTGTIQPSTSAAAEAFTVHDLIGAFHSKNNYVTQPVSMK
jgi:hypothetical protein